MFSHCSSLKYLTLPNYMPLIETTDFMFDYCLNLSSINLSFFQSATKLKSMEKIFSNCISLTKIDFPNLKTKELTDISGMFIR